MTTVTVYCARPGDYRVSIDDGDGQINVIDALTRVRRAKTNQHGRTLPKAMARRLARIEAALSDLTVEMSDALSGS